MPNQNNNEKWEKQFKETFLQVIDLIVDGRGIVDFLEAEEKVKDLISQAKQQGKREGYLKGWNDGYDEAINEIDD